MTNKERFFNASNFEQIRNVLCEDARLRFGEITTKTIRESMAYRYKDIPIAEITDEEIRKIIIGK